MYIQIYIYMYVDIYPTRQAIQKAPHFLRRIAPVKRNKMPYIYMNTSIDTCTKIDNIYLDVHIYIYIYIYMADQTSNPKGISLPSPNRACEHEQDASNIYE